MIDLRQALVGARIANLEREGAAIRAERERDHLREHAVAGTDATDHPADLPTRREQLGRWLVVVGQAIAGRPVTAVRVGEPISAAFRADDDPCNDGNDRLAHAA